MPKRETTDKRQRIIRAVIAANPDIDPSRIAKIVALTIRLERGDRGAK